MTENPISRRRWIAGLAAAAGSAQTGDDAVVYLQSLLRSREWVESYTEKRPAVDGYHPNWGWVYDYDLGWVLRDSYRDDGMGGSRTYNTYEKSGARKRAHFASQTARIHTYGNSFTHCDQVSDGETWQEILAAHLGESVENYGVGGYSVYQAYKRMRKVEEAHPGDYILLNVFDDDHYRNLDAWRAFRGRTVREGTLPHLRVHVAKDEVREMPNACASPQDVYMLENLDWVVARFRDDPVVARNLAARRKPVTRQDAQRIAAAFGVPLGGDRPDSDWESELQRIHTHAALFATIKVLQMAEAYARQAGKRLFVLLSYGARNVKRHLRGEPPFDQLLLDFLKTRPDPYLDLREAHLAEFKSFRIDPDAYADRYFIGHYNPAGNFFCAMAIKDRIVERLQPRPRTYPKRARL
jgi:hypothetical protein